jgi:uncharacterized damage-inducible protein DinB
MSRDRIAPPQPDEYSPFYASYVTLTQGHDPLELLELQLSTLRDLCAGLTEEKALARYAPDKWSIKQVLGHLADTERVFSYRLFRISRGDATPLAGFDQNTYVEAAHSDQRPLPALLEEFLSVRTATLRLAQGLSADEWSRRGVANGVPVSARALLFIASGHVAHHLKILRDRYGVDVS